MKTGLQVLIEDKLIDVVDETIDIDYRIFDLATLGTIESDKSLPIVAPFTQANNRAFGHLNDFATENNKPKRKLKASVLEDGAPIMQNAIARITKTGNGYELEIGAGNYSLFESIRNLKLQDLDWLEYDHFWTLENVHASRNNTAGYIYLATDYFADPATALIDNIDRVIRADYIYPATFVHTILTKIGEYTGIKLVGDFLESSEFKSLVLPFSRTDYVRNNKASRYLIDVSTPVTDTIGNGVLGGLIFNVINSPQENYFTASTASNYGGQLQFADQVRVKGRIKMNINNGSGSNRVLTISRTESRFLGISGAFQQFLTTVPLPPGSTYYEYDFEGVAENNEDRQQITFSFSTDGFNVTVDAGANLTIYEATILRGQEIKYNTPFGNSKTINYVTLSSAMPDMNCGDLLKALGNMFGLIFQYDGLTNTVKVERFRKLYENQAIAEDWTDKINMPSVAVEYELGNYGQLNRMLLDNPDTLDRLLGSYTFTIDNEHLDPEIEVFKLPFQYTESVLRLEDLAIASIPILQAEEDPDNPGQYIYSLGGDTRPRILALKQLTPTGDPLDYYDGTATLSSTNVPVGYFFDAGQAFNLDLNSLINTYNPERIGMLQKSRKANMQVDLKLTDMVNLDFFVPVYVRTWGKYFAKHKVNRRGNAFSSVELVEM